jgi:cytochrome c oxidase assembly factor CtaG
MPAMHRAMRVGISLTAGAAMACAAAGAASAHGDSAPEPTLGSILTSWAADPLPWLGIVVAIVGYLVMVRLVNRAHPRSPVPRGRIVAWLAGVAVIAVALVSAVDVYADSLFTVHMVQHLLLAMVAPPLLALGAPTTLMLRAATPSLRRSLLIPLLHSRLVTAVSWPPLGWIVLSVVMWATHFSPLFNAALENQLIHSLEHLLYLGAGLLFWWPVVGADPNRWRLGSIGRMAYLAAQMPVNTAVGLVILFAPGVLYPHYATLDRGWGPDPLTDQQAAGATMWGAGDVILLVALALAIAAWLRAEEKRSRRIERRAAGHDERAPVESR